MLMVWRKRCRQVAAIAGAVLLTFATAACGSTDMRTVVTVWSWEPSMKMVAENFEKLNPDIRVDIKGTSGYENLNTAIEDGYGLPDVVQLEYFALQQYAVSGQLRNIDDEVEGYNQVYTPGTWASVHLNGSVYGLPMDSGPMAFFYNQDDFAAAGVDASTIRTWDDYYEAAKKLKSIGMYIAADGGDASFYDAMIWSAGGKPYATSSDGKTVKVNLDSDTGTKTFTEFWQKMIDEGLINTHLSTWSDGWKRALGSGKVASVFSGAWMPSLLLSDVPGTAGLWRVAQLPTADGIQRTAENGGSALAILHSSRKPRAAFRFIEYVCHNSAGIQARVDGGAFPADNATLSRPEFLAKTTVKDARGINIPYFGGQAFNEVLSQAAENVSTGYQYLPFEVYARSDFHNTVGKAYHWSNLNAAREQIRAEIAAGKTNEDGSELTLPDSPGTKISLKDGIEAWQKDLTEYGTNQGFTIQ